MSHFTLHATVTREDWHGDAPYPLKSTKRVTELHDENLHSAENVMETLRQWADEIEALCR